MGIKIITHTWPAVGWCSIAQNSNNCSRIKSKYDIVG
jgi:hypothetical protein